MPSLPKVLRLYERAAHMAEDVGRSIKVSALELGVLRYDSLEHKNIAIRELSQARYHNALEALTNQ